MGQVSHEGDWRELTPTTVLEAVEREIEITGKVLGHARHESPCTD